MEIIKKSLGVFVMLVLVTSFVKITVAQDSYITIANRILKAVPEKQVIQLKYKHSISTEASGDPWYTPQRTFGSTAPREWDTQHIIATKLISIVFEPKNYRDGSGWDTRSILVGYGLGNNGNFDDWRQYSWEVVNYKSSEERNQAKKEFENTAYYAAMRQALLQAKDSGVKKKLWEDNKRALMTALLEMDTQDFTNLKDIVKSAKAYFGKNYDIKKAKAWYDEDVATHKFARKNYKGEELDRKATAMLERLMFKHDCMTLEEIRYWLGIISTFLSVF